MPFALLLLLLGPAEDATDKLIARYQEIRDKDDYTHARNQLLRDLGKHATPDSRAFLLKILRTTHSGDERVNALLSLGRIADRETLEAMVQAVGRKSQPALVEALAEALSGATDAEGMKWLATGAFEEKKADLLYAIARAQERLGDPAAVPHLTSLYREHRDPDVRFAAVCGLAATGGDALADAAKDEDWHIRLAAARDAAMALGLLDDPAASVRQAACRTCAQGKIEKGVPALIRLVEADPRLRTRHEASLALGKISGKDYGLDPGAWRRWWKEKTTEIKPGTFSVARYYSFSVYSDRLLFIIDISGSMSWPWSDRRPKRIEVARQQLEKVLGQIDKKSLFNLMVYSDKVRMWQKKEVEAEEKNVTRALAWAARAMDKPDGDTYTYDALEKAFARNPQFDTIYLLSDGNPSDGDYREPEGMIESVKAWNRYRQARIYTIHLTLANVDRGRPITGERLKLMGQLMNGLAKATGGSTVLVENPPKDPN